VSDDGLGVQLARFNPIGLESQRPSDPVYAGPGRGGLPAAAT